MKPSSQYRLLCFTFRLFSFLADRTNGAALFVRPKLMIGALMLSLGLTLPERVVAQKPYEDEKTPPAPTVSKDSTKTEKEEIFPTCYMVELPEFPGGTDSMMTFLSKNIIYPKEAIEKKIEGLVVCQFNISKDGSISNPKIVKALHPLLDTEALRAIKLMPKWHWRDTQAAMPGFPYTLPIRFTLPDKKK